MVRITAVTILLFLPIVVSFYDLHAGELEILNLEPKSLSEESIALDHGNLKLRSIGDSPYGPIFTYFDLQRSLLYGFTTDGKLHIEKELHEYAFESSFLRNGELYWVVHPISEGKTRYDTYDTRTNTLLYSFYSKYWLKPDLNGNYYYGIYEHFSTCMPAIYDLEGNLIGEAISEYGIWDLRPLDDSTFLFLDGNRLEIIALPNFEIKRVITFPELSEASLRVGIAISPDKTYCAVFTYTDVVIYNLLSDTKSSIADFNDTLGITNGNFVISQDAKYLLFLRYPEGRIKYDLYSRNDDNEYIKVIANEDGLIPSVSIPLYDQIIVDDKTFLYYVKDVRGTLLFHTLLFRFPDPESNSLKVAAFHGHTFFNKASDGYSPISFDIDRRPEPEGGILIRRYGSFDDR